MNVNPTTKLNLLFWDRIGFVADISRRVAEQEMNIVSMEVERKQELADVYLEVDPVTRNISGKEILESLSGIDGLQSIRFIKIVVVSGGQTLFAPASQHIICTIGSMYCRYIYRH